MKYVFVTPSGESRVVDCSRKDVMKHAHCWAIRWSESVDVYKCLPVKQEVLPHTDLVFASPKERKHWKEVVRTRCQLESAFKQFQALPKQGSFSGIHLSGEINRLQKRLDELGDTKSKRHYPEVTIEVG